MIALASYMSVENNSKILMIDTNLNDKTIQNAFLELKKMQLEKQYNS